MADPAFYRINKGNEQHWLLGSIHAGKPLYPLPDPVERAWQQSRALVMEVDMTHISQEQWQEMGAITRLVDGKTLKDHLPIDLYRRTPIAAGQNGLNESMLALLRPLVCGHYPDPGGSWSAPAIAVNTVSTSTSPSGRTTAANPSSGWRPCWSSSAISRASATTRP